MPEAAAGVNEAIESLIANKRYAEALRLANEEVRRHPGDLRLLNLCANLYLTLRREDTAARLLRRVADVHAANGSPAKAVAALKKIERMGRNDPTMYESLASRIEQERTEDSPVHFDALTMTEEELEAPKTLETPAPLPEELRIVDETNVVDRAVPSPLFDDFSHDELLAFIKGLQLQVFDSGDIIVSQGGPGESLFILTSGIVKAFVRDRDQSYRRVRTLHDGDFFGEISILSGGPRSATLTAATRCELLELDRKTLNSITAAHPRVSEIMRRFYDERVAADRSLDLR